MSKITLLIRLMEKHIKQMSKALDDLEKTDLPFRRKSGDNSEPQQPQNDIQNSDGTAPKS
ncbi:MAG: hypothetical protein ACM3Q2_08390 [Syntrophothermus sp.]